MTQPVWELLPWIAGLLILLAVLRTAEGSVAKFGLSR